MYPNSTNIFFIFSSVIGLSFSLENLLINLYSPTGNSIKYQNNYYQPYLNNSLKCFMPKTECLVIKALNSDLFVTIDEQVLELKELSRNKRFSKEFNKVIEVKENKKHIPPNSSFEIKII